MTNWESEKQYAEELRQLTAQVKQLQDEIRGDALPAKKTSGPTLPTDDERRERSIAPEPSGPEAPPPTARKRR